MSIEENPQNANANADATGTGTANTEVNVRIVDPETTIFVASLAQECTEQDLRDLFAEEHGLVEVEIPSTKSKGGRSFYNRYGFVKFPQKINIDEIKEKYDNALVKDKNISVRKVLTQEERDAEREERMRNRKNNRNTRPRGGRPGFGNRGAAVPAPPKKDRTPLEEMERSSDTLYVNNIPYHATKEELGEFFGTKPDLVVLPMRRMKDTNTKRVFFSKKMNRGIAFVTFEDLPENGISKKVDEFQGKNFQERPITVDIAAVRPPQEREETSADEPKE